MDTERFECFLVLSDILNYTTASAMLHKSQSVLSRQISALESDLGFELFIRDSKQVLLTSAGAHMREGIRALQRQYDRLLEESREISEGKQGHITIGIAVGETNEMYSDMINDYSLAFPSVDIKFITYSIHDISNLLSNQAMDLAFTVITNPWFSFINRPDFSYVKVGTRHDYLYIPADHPLADKNEAELTLADFKDETFLIFNDFEVDFERGTTIKTFSKAGFIPKFQRCASLTDLMAGMFNRQGICIGSNRLFLYNSPAFKKLRLNEIAQHQEIMLWSMSNPNPCVDPFVTHIKHYLRERPNFAETDIIMSDAK